MLAFAAGAADRVVKKKNGQPIKISWIGKTLNNPWWISCADAAILEAENIGVDMKVALPQEEVDLEKQVTMVESAIEQGVDAIIISASSSDGNIPAIRKARDAGIKIINFDTRISDPRMYDAYVGADDMHGAYKAGMYMGEKLGGKGTVGLITGLLAQSTGVDRRKGFLDAMKNFPGIKVVENTAEWRSDLAANVTTNMLTANPDMKGIFACNDQIFSGKGIVTSLAWGIDGRVDYVLEGNINYTGAVIRWLVDDLGMLASSREAERVARSAKTVEGLYLVPAFSGLGAPYWDESARGVICGLSRGVGKAEIVRAAEECIAHQIADIARLMQEETGFEIDCLKVDGGPVRDSFLMQFQADVLGAVVSVPGFEELSGCGPAYLAGMAIGLYPKDAIRHEPEARYLPAIPEEERHRRRRGWRDAVAKVLTGKNKP